MRYIRVAIVVIVLALLSGFYVSAMDDPADYSQILTDSCTFIKEHSDAGEVVRFFSAGRDVYISARRDRLAVIGIHNEGDEQLNALIDVYSEKVILPFQNGRIFILFP